MVTTMKKIVFILLVTFTFSVSAERYSVVRDSDGLVTNVIEGDGTQDPGPNHTLRVAGNAGPGWTWNGTGFDPPIESLEGKRSRTKGMIKRALKAKLKSVDDAMTPDNLPLLGVVFQSVKVNPGTKLERGKDLYVYAKSQLTWVDTATEAEIDAYDPNTDPGWPE